MVLGRIRIRRRTQCKNLAENDEGSSSASSVLVMGKGARNEGTRHVSFDMENTVGYDNDFGLEDLKQLGLWYSVEDCNSFKVDTGKDVLDIHNAGRTKEETNGVDVLDLRWKYIETMEGVYKLCTIPTTQDANLEVATNCDKAVRQLVKQTHGQGDPILVGMDQWILVEYRKDALKRQKTLNQILREIKQKGADDSNRDQEATRHECEKISLEGRLFARAAGIAQAHAAGIADPIPRRRRGLFRRLSQRSGY